MPTAESPAGSDPRPEDVLTLAEVAVYLRVPEDAVLELAEKGLVPAQKIGKEWRFLRKALQLWLLSGGPHFQKATLFPLAMWWHPFGDEMRVRLLEEMRFLVGQKAEKEETIKPGSKQAVLKHFGVFKDDEDLEERLADARKRREHAVSAPLSIRLPHASRRRHL